MAGRRVLVVLHEEHLGGASISVLRCVPELERRGWAFAFWAPRPSALYDDLVEQGYEVFGEERGLIGYSWQALRIPPGPLRRLSSVPRYVRAMRAALKAFRPDLVHANSMYTLVEGLVARAAGVPVMFHVHEMVRPNRKGRIARALIHRTGSEVAAVSQAGVEALSDDDHRASLIPECVPIPEAYERRPRDTTPVVGTIGVLSRRKGTDTFVEAARILSEEDISFKLVGAPTAPLDEAWALELLRDLPANITYEKRVDPSEELKGWDVFVLPSREDPFPIVILEAMSMSLPVVAAAADGMIEQVTPETGFLVPVGDGQALAKAILELTSNPELRLTMGGAGRQRVVAEFSVERQASLIDAAYERALSR